MTTHMTITIATEEEHLALNWLMVQFSAIAFARVDGGLASRAVIGREVLEEIRKNFAVIGVTAQLGSQPLTYPR